MDNSAAESSGKFEVVKCCYPAHGYAIFWTDLIRGQVVDFQKVFTWQNSCTHTVHNQLMAVMCVTGAYLVNTFAVCP